MNLEQYSRNASSYLKLLEKVLNPTVTSNRGKNNFQVDYLSFFGEHVKPLCHHIRNNIVSSSRNALDQRGLKSYLIELIELPPRTEKEKL
ncbi:hypothetical protein EVAR_99123_1 [Eumeta japonica]|uniref:Uncharacterized protein n=1 Tax=Eumeta variegata TaxID=151549 RepID=A0A4C1YRP4_EUMVA|nr:hypothetical protein EVAR_99123_1 [Eumeta japonica]